MTEETESIRALLEDEALLRRVLEREPSLVCRVVSHADFLEALFSHPDALRCLMRAPLVTDDYHLDQLLASVGGDGASLRARPSREEARLLHLVSDAGGLGRLLRDQPALAAIVAANPAFVEQVRVRKPHFYRALLEKAQKHFDKDTELAEEIRAERESLEIFTSEGGKKERETEPRRCETRNAQLLNAACVGRTDVVRALLEGGADPNFQEKKLGMDGADVCVTIGPLRSRTGAAGGRGRSQPSGQRQEMDGTDVCGTERPTIFRTAAA